MLWESVWGQCFIKCEYCSTMYWNATQHQRDSQFQKSLNDMNGMTIAVSKTLLTAAVLFLLLFAVAQTLSAQIRCTGGVIEEYAKAIFTDPQTVVSKPAIAANDSQMLSCLRTVLLQQQLPIGVGWGRRGKRQKMLLGVFAHHWDASNVDRWNDKIRMDPIPQLKNASSCSVWEVGANIQAADTEQFLQQYPTCSYHAYEPVPEYFAQLDQYWAHESRVTPHKYGLGPEEFTFQVSPGALHGQAT